MKVLVGMSGGVDSSVAAAILQEQGHMVSGAYIKTWMNESGDSILGKCPWEDDINDAHAVAEILNIDFQIINLMAEYRRSVVDYLVDGYRRGITPNPDIMCNREIKFGVFLQIAKQRGFDAVATGHYVRRVDRSDGSSDILEGIDDNKDQSYFLAMVRQDQLQNALFPLGELQKNQVRQIARDKKLPNAAKKDSQGICFLGKVRIGDFLKEFIEDRPGDIVTAEGKVVGHHKGLHRFTIGQRKGIGVPSNADNEHYVVVAKDYATNQLVVTFEKPLSPLLYTEQVRIRDISFVNRPLTERAELLAKPRYRDSSTPIVFEPLGNGCANVLFRHPQRALAQGQVLALYDGEVLLGGGFYDVIMMQGKS